MSNARTWLRAMFSLPVYALSVVFWILTVYLIVTSAMKMLSRFATPELIGEGLVDLVVAIATAGIGSGVWLLGRYIRTSNFRKPQPPSSPADLA